MSEPTDYLRKEPIAVIFPQTFSVPEYSINIFLKRSDKFPVNLLVDTVFFFENYKWNLPIIAFISGSWIRIKKSLILCSNYVDCLLLECSYHRFPTVFFLLAYSLFTILC